MPFGQTPSQIVVVNEPGQRKHGEKTQADNPKLPALRLELALGTHLKTRADQCDQPKQNTPLNQTHPLALAPTRRPINQSHAIRDPRQVRCNERHHQQ
mgnify:CR=1 FL=1